MKKRFTVLLALVMVFILTGVTTAFADAAAYDMDPVDYYVYVSTPDGGLNMRHGPGTEYNKVMNTPIPDGVKLHISYVSNNWGYTEYNGEYGWVALKQTTSAPSASQSYTKHKAGYNVYVAAPDGGVNLRQGPDKSYQKVMTEIIPNNIKLYIEYISGDWGYTTYNGYEGWVYIPQTTTTAPIQSPAEDIKPEPEVTKEPVISQENQPQTADFTDDEIPAEEEADKEINASAKAKNSLAKPFILGAALILVVIIISIIVLLCVNKNSRRY